MNIKLSKTLTAAGAVAALAFPALATAKPGNGHGQGHGPGQHGHSLQPHGQGQLKPRNYIVKGNVSAVNGNVVTVDVTRANHHGAGLAGQSVQFDLTTARVVGRVHDPSGVQVGDRVIVQARLPRDLTGTQQPYAARRLVDRGPKPQPQSTSQTTQSDDSSSISSGGSDQSDS
jgi:hypothetical protein